MCVFSIRVLGIPPNSVTSGWAAKHSLGLENGMSEQLGGGHGG